MSVIEIKNLGYVYSPNTPFETAALKDINLSIDEGEYLGIIGHTGSGKTTLIKILCGLLNPTSGRVELNGEDIFAKKYDTLNLRKNIGIVFQYPEYQLFEETVERDIAFGPIKQGLSEEEVKLRVSEAAQLLEIPKDVLSKSPFDLSGGQKRRAAIAGVIAMKPKILILDEPVAGLDPIGRESLFDLIGKLHESGTTIVLITHSMDDLAAHAKRVIVLKNGEIKMQGSPREIFGNAKKISEMGLNVPQISELVSILQERGINIPSDILTQDEFVEFVNRAVKDA